MTQIVVNLTTIRVKWNRPHKRVTILTRSFKCVTNMTQKSSGKILKSLDTKTKVKILPILFWTLMAKNFLRIKKLPINLTNSLLVLLQNLLVSCLSLVDFMMWTQKGSKVTIGISSLGPLCFTRSVKTLFTMSWITLISPRALAWMAYQLVSFLKDAAEDIKYPITSVINLSIRSQVFPSEMKVAKVKPLFKKKSRCCKHFTCGF